jgi:hypothetical protein
MLNTFRFFGRNQTRTQTGTANYDLAASWDGGGNLTTVGSNGGPSHYGTYDQSGNVWEWNDLTGLSGGTSRGARGGAFTSVASELSSSDRRAFSLSYKAENLGFRIACRQSENFSNVPFLVSVGDTANGPDPKTSGFGSVGYQYKISQYAVTNCDYVLFLNSVASADPYGLYHTEMSGPKGGISRRGSSGSYLYSSKSNYHNKPVNFVSWFECARYCNWLHNGKPSGAQDSTTTEEGAYPTNEVVPNDLGNSGWAAPGKLLNARYWIPNENEWYKAAYYSGNSNTYWTYATKSDSAPNTVSANNVGDGPISSDYYCASIL